MRMWVVEYEYVCCRIWVCVLSNMRMWVGLYVRTSWWYLTILLVLSHPLAPSFDFSLSVSVFFAFVPLPLHHLFLSSPLSAFLSSRVSSVSLFVLLSLSLFLSLSLPFSSSLSSSNSLPLSLSLFTSLSSFLPLSLSLFHPPSLSPSPFLFHPLSLSLSPYHSLSFIPSLSFSQHVTLEELWMTKSALETFESLEPLRSLPVLTCVYLEHSPIAKVSVWINLIGRLGESISKR